MTPPTSSPPHQSETYTEAYSVSQRGSPRWQTVQTRQRSCAKSTGQPKERADLRSWSGAQRSVREPLLDQYKAQCDQGFEQIKKAPENSLEIARRLHEVVPNKVCVYDLETRALLILGRFQECLAVLDRLPCAHKVYPSLRMTRGRVLQELGRFGEAEVEYRALYERHSHTPHHRKINGLALAWVLERMTGGREREALAVLTEVRQCLVASPDTPCDDPEVEVALARCLQAQGGQGHLHRALNILTLLRQKKAGNRPDTPCNDIKIEIALAMVLQDLGGKNLQASYTIWSNLHQKTPHNREIALGLAISLNKLATPDRKKEALERLTAIRRRAAGNRVDTACDDRAIELALAKVLRGIGGQHNREQALDILLRLRQQVAGEPDTPCGDKAIEVALGKYWEEEGGRDSEHKALAIFTELRKRAAGNRVGIPCHDKDIEIALAHLLVNMGQKDDLQKALAIFTRLRSLYGRKDQRTPCDSQDVELPLAYCLMQLNDWQAFDHWNRERPRFEDSHAVELLQSIRYFIEFLTQDTDLKPRPDLLEKAFRHAQTAVHNSDHADPSSLSQLGHCYQALCRCTPAARQKFFGLKASAEELDTCARDCFDQSARLDPSRRYQAKDQLWRQQEREWLERTKEPSCAPCKEAGHSYALCPPPTPQPNKQKTPP